MKKKFKLLFGLMLTMALILTFAATAWAAAGDVPAHDKIVNDNGDGTLKIELNVTGDANVTESKQIKANIIVVYDSSYSMLTWGTDGVERAQNAINADYEHRADAAEKAVATFATNLFGIENSDIQMALLTFDANARPVQGWTSTLTDITGKLNAAGTNNSYKLTYDHGTNWEAALNLARTTLGSADADPTFVVFVTDGAPTMYVLDNGNNYPGNGTYLNDDAGRLEAARQSMGVAHSIDTYDTVHDDYIPHPASADTSVYKDNTMLFGIYAWGNNNEGDYLDDVIYYAIKGSDRGAGSDDFDYKATNNTDVSDQYFPASDTAALTAAIDAIFQSITEAIGVYDTVIQDGTTSEVTTSSGDVAELLEVDTNSYEYFLTIPLDSNKFKDNDAVEWTVSVADGKATFTSGEGADAKKAVFDLADGAQPSGAVKVKWTGTGPDSDNNPETNFYPAPPAAQKNGSSVDWDLKSLGVLLEGVTYTYTFDVWPGQDTLDLIADLKNGVVEYEDTDGDTSNDLDANIKKYIVKDGEEYFLKTNTGATLSYKDNRLPADQQPKPAGFTDPDAQPTKAVELMSVAKEWVNELDSVGAEEIDLDVLRDGDPTYVVALNEGNDFENDVNISIGILSYDEEEIDAAKDEYAVVTVRAKGHNFSFQEPEDLAYQWELDAPTVRPMLINGGEGAGKKPTMLKKVTEDDIKEIEGADDVSDIIAMLAGGKTDGKYFPIEGEYYVKDESVVTLTATNSRRSYLELKKTVTGENAPEDELFKFEFEFTVPSDDSEGSGQEAVLKAASDEDEIWFSVKDPDKRVYHFAFDSEDHINTGATPEIGRLIDSDPTAAKPVTNIEWHAADDTYAKNYYTYKYDGKSYTVPTDATSGAPAGTVDIIVSEATEDQEAVTESYEYYEYYTGYYSFTGSSDVEMQADWVLRFINLPTGTTYTVTEDLSELYVFESAELTLTDSPSDYEFTPEKIEAPEDPEFEGEIADPNLGYLLTFTNKYTLATVVVEKTFNGVPADEITELFPDFTATVSFEATEDFTGEEAPEAIELKLTEDEEESDEESTIKVEGPEVEGSTFTWTISNLPVGLNVTVEESGYEGQSEDYTFIPADDPDKPSKITDTTVGKGEDGADAPTAEGAPTELSLENNYQGAGGMLKIVKTFDGPADLPETTKFKITGPDYNETVSIDKFEKTGDSEYTYEVEVPAGEYTVTENKSSAMVDGYTLHILGDNGVPRQVDENGYTFRIRNRYADPSEQYVPEELNGEDHYAYMIGYPDGLVHPERNITRAEVATIFFRLLTDEAREANLTTVNSFGDVNDGQWFNVSISTMANMGIVNGYPDGDFHPNDNITRAEFAAIAARFDKEAKDSANIFTDIDGHWAKSYILRAVNRGWINGYPDSTFRPDRLATRAEVAAMVNRVLVRDPEDPDDLLPDMIKWPDNMDTNAWYYLDIQEATNTHEYERVTKPTEVWIQMLENPDWTKYQF